MIIENPIDLFLKQNPLIDVRAPVEFGEGSLPNAINLPLLNDAERALVGTIYKVQGQDAAITLGYQLVAGEIKKDRVQAWLNFIKQNPEAVIYCFRGGLRSKTTQKWLADLGVDRPILKGGYKKARQQLMQICDEISAQVKMLALTGPTGSGKTIFMQSIEKDYPCIDLEKMSCHRGSAFGAKSISQPTQINFENELSVALLKYQDTIKRSQLPPRPLLIEDESRLIGRCVLPDVFFQHLKSAPIIWLEVPLKDRVENILKEYVLDSPITSGNEDLAIQQYTKFKEATQAISRKLGGARTQEVLDGIQISEQEFLRNRSFEVNRIWITKLLLYYYDPSYAKALEKRNDLVVFRGSPAECLEFLYLSQI
jgi:tRNA 2-selenouridine synthase